MHARHRNPGNGYRSGSMGMGLGASRMSPEGLTRGHGGFYNSEYRGFNRGFGRDQGQPKNYKPPQTPPQRGDIFMEAGRLAAEYLVSQGLLPPSMLSGKWQNGSLKKQAGDFQEYRAQEGEQFPPEGRTSVHSRIGHAVADVGGQIRRRSFDDEYGSSGSRNHMKGRRRQGSFRGYSAEWGRENGRWLDRTRPSPDTEGDGDNVSAQYEEQQVVKDVGGGAQKSSAIELAPKSKDVTNSESELDINPSQDDVDSKASSSGAWKDGLCEMDAELTKISVNSENLSEGTEDVKNGISNNETEKQSSAEELPVQQCAIEGNPLFKSSSNLLNLFKFPKVPTRTRSSLACRASKVETISSTEEGNTSDRCRGDSVVPIQDDHLDGSLGDMSSIVSHDTKSLDQEIAKASTFQSEVDAGELAPGYGVEQGKCVRSQSFPDRVFLSDHGEITHQGPPVFGRSSSMVKERGEKRPCEDSDVREGTKKLREWLSPMASKADQYFHLSNLREKTVNSEEQGASPPIEKVTMDVNQDGLFSSSSFAKGEDEHIAYAQEKQLFPSTFKICDLNLMEASDINENHNSDPIVICPSISETQKEEEPVDVDLSMSNSIMSSENGKCATNGKDIEIIDLENDSAQEDKAADDLERKQEAVFVGLDNFSTHAQNVDVIPDVHDYGDGLIISEFLSAFQNIPPVPDDINPLQNGMGLHNGEGTIGDDDSIYMSLEEIPLSFLQAWEQPPPQEYGKPF